MRLLQLGYSIISIDETGLKETSNFNYSWNKINTQKKTQVKQAFENVTVIAATTDAGLLYYSIIRGSNHEVTYAIFLEDLVERLDEVMPKWRETHILI